MKILFPTDFSPAAENAYIYALKLAQRFHGTVTVLHVYEELELHSWIEDATDTDRLNEQIQLGEFERFREQIDLLKRIAAEHGGERVEVNYVLKPADVIVEAILDQARTELADLIVMGTKGASGLREVFFGSVASRVMEAAACPVFAVPDVASYRGIEKLALALEYKDNELPLIEHAVALARRFDAQLHCIHVDVNDPDRMRVKTEEYRHAFQGEPGVSFHAVTGTDVEKSLLEFMRYNQVDALVLRMEPKSILKELFSFSIAKRVAYHADTPMIALSPASL